MKKYYKFLRKSLIELKKNDGFTLAEVLITLGIIGVVAAMTIPTLIANVQGQRVRSQFKKTLSTLNQAGKMAQAQYDWDFGAVEQQGSHSLVTCNNDNPESSKSMCALLNGTIKGAYHTYNILQLPLTRATSNVFAGEGSYIPAYQLNDGAFLGFQASIKLCTLPVGTDLKDAMSKMASGAGTDSHGNIIPAQAGLKQCIGFIDINGTSLPNKEVTCADGTVAFDPQNPCVVSNKNIGDIIPVVFHDGVVEPATNAGKYLLNTAK
ncbi:type II secretion system protein [bacterium]|nr:type II secretion system protein [bacterium]